MALAPAADGSVTAVDATTRRRGQTTPAQAGSEPTPLNSGASAGVASSLGSGTLQTVYDPAILRTQPTHRSYSYKTLEEAQSLSDRIQALEQQMQDLLKRLEGVEGQARSLDARVGRGERGRVSTPAKK
jgi:streptogramin lyase